MSAQRIAELRAKITRLDTALEELATGQRTVKLSYDGQSVEYGQGDFEKVKELRRQAADELASLTGVRRGPFRQVTG